MTPSTWILWAVAVAWVATASTTAIEHDTSIAPLSCEPGNGTLAAMILPVADATASATTVLAIVTGALVLVTGALAIITFLGNRSARKDAQAQIEAIRETTQQQVDVVRESSAQQVAAARLEIAAMRETTSEQVAAARDQLDASYRPLLIEVSPSGAITPDMGAHRQPDIAVAPNREIPMTISLRPSDGRTQEIDPRAAFMSLNAGSIYLSVPLRNVGRGLAVIDEDGVRIEPRNVTADLRNAMQAVFVSRVRVPIKETTRITIDARPNHVEQKALTSTSWWTISVPYTDFAGRQRTAARIGVQYSPEGAPEKPVSRRRYPDCARVEAGSR